MILGNDTLRTLPIIEINQNAFDDQKNPFRSFKTKIIEKKSETKVCPAILTTIEEEMLKDLAVETYEAVGCRDYARIDFRWDKDGNPYVLDVNAIPRIIPELAHL